MLTEVYYCPESGCRPGPVCDFCGSPRGVSLSFVIGRTCGPCYQAHQERRVWDAARRAWTEREAIERKGAPAA